MRRALPEAISSRGHWCPSGARTNEPAAPGRTRAEPVQNFTLRTTPATVDWNVVEGDLEQVRRNCHQRQTGENAGSKSRAAAERVETSQSGRTSARQSAITPYPLNPAISGSPIVRDIPRTFSRGCSVTNEHLALFHSPMPWTALNCSLLIRVRGKFREGRGAKPLVGEDEVGRRFRASWEVGTDNLMRSRRGESDPDHAHYEERTNLQNSGLNATGNHRVSHRR